MSDYPMLISNKLHSFRNFLVQIYLHSANGTTFVACSVRKEGFLCEIYRFPLFMSPY